MIALALRSVILLLALSAAAFFLIAAMPADPAITALRAWNVTPTPQLVSALRHEWGLDRPVLPRFGLWLIRFMTGDWGTSFRTGQPVRQEVLSRLPLSLSLGTGGLALAFAGAVPLGFFSALRPGGLADRLSRALVITVQAVPAFFLGLIAIWVLAVQFHLLRPFGANAGTVMLSIALIGAHSLGVLARVGRRGLLEAAKQPFMRTALAKGLSRGEALRRHGGPHALLAMLAALRSEAAWAVGTSAAMEVLFGLPGISRFLVDSIAARDYFVLQAYVVVAALWLILLNAAIAIVMARLDPRRA